MLWQDLLFGKFFIGQAMQVVSTTRSKSDFHRLDATWCAQQTWCKTWCRLVKNCYPQACKSANIKLQQVCTIFATCIGIDAFNRLAASCSIRLVKICYPQACCNLLQQLATGLQISICSKSSFHRLAATWWSQQTRCNLMTTCSKPVRSTTCSKSVAILAVYAFSFVESQSAN